MNEEKKEKYPLCKTIQSIEYNVLHSLEKGKTQALHIRNYLKGYGLNYSTKQISSALQRLKKDSIVVYEELMWWLKNKSDEPIKLETDNKKNNYQFITDSEIVD